MAGGGGEAILSELKAISESLNVAGRVRWLGVRSDLSVLLDGADGYVLSSAWEGMPLAVAEAMAMKKPVVATDVGGVKELVGDVGLLVQAGDAEALAKNMLSVMQASPEERAAMGAAGRARVEKHFDIEKKAGEWEAVYREIVTEPNVSKKAARNIPSR